MSGAKTIKSNLDGDLNLLEEKKCEQIESSQPANQDQNAPEKPVEAPMTLITENQNSIEPTKEKNIEIAPETVPKKNAETTEEKPKSEAIQLQVQPEKTSTIEMKAEPEKNPTPVVAEIKAENVENSTAPTIEAKVEQEVISTTTPTELNVMPEKKIAEVPLETKNEPKEDKPEIPIETKLEEEKIPTETKVEPEKIPVEIPTDTKMGPEPIVSINGESAQQPQLPEIGQLESIGAGDPGLNVKSVENDVCKLERKKTDEKKEDTITSVTVVEDTSPESKESITPPKICDSEPQLDQTPTTDKVKAEKDTIGDASISTTDKSKQETTDDEESYKRKLEIAEKKLADLQVSYDSLIKGGGDEVALTRMVEQLKSKLLETTLQLHDRMRDVANQEKQINALNHQVASLKEVESLTRSLLQIRNMEVKQLQTEVDNMEVKINEERARYNTMINKMDSAVQLNADLKKEYETQLCLFRDLREKYEEKVTLLSAEKKALETSQAAPK